MEDCNKRFAWGIAGTLLAIIIAMLVYFFQFYEPRPTQLNCANLYQSNICTEAVCTTAFPSPDIPSPKWTPEIKTNTSKLTGIDMLLPIDAIGKEINTEIDKFSNTFDSNVCSALNSLETKAISAPATTPLYGYTAKVAATSPGTEVPAKFNCMKLIDKINTDIASAKTNYEKMKLINLRRVIVDNCNTSPVGETKVPAGINIGSDTKILANHFNTGGAVSNVFCT